MIRGMRLLTRASSIACVGLAVALIVGSLVGSVAALPKDPIDPPTVNDNTPYQPPSNGFSWSVPSRFGATNLSTGLIDYHWNSDQNTAWNGPMYTYDPNWINPSSWPAYFDACPTQNEANAGPGQTTNEYAWTFSPTTLPSGKAYPGLTIPPAHNCALLNVSFPEQATYAVSLTVIPHDGSTPAGDYQQTIRIKDYLVVSLGDSYSSGEGNPDIPVRYDSFGQVAAGAVWEDRRCHRSAAAAPAQAAMRLENADPHTSVTFLSFACSGATISKNYWNDADPLAPYTPNGSLTQFQGSGILGSYRGTEPPDPGCDYGPAPADDGHGNPGPNNRCSYLPSQIDQLKFALDSSARHRIDALMLSAGGNDLGFGPVAALCVLYYDCPNHPVVNDADSGMVPLSTRVEEDANAAQAQYAALSNALLGFDVGKTYITEYPDPSKDQNGNYCGVMLDDVIPAWMQGPLALKAATGFDDVPLIPYRIDQGGSWPDHGEVGWAGGKVGALLNGAVSAAAAAHGWTLVQGINDGTGNLFGTHGYCSSDSWIRSATDASFLEGPRDNPVACNPISLATLPGAIACALVSGPSTSRTKGTLHPTAAGHLAVADRIQAYLFPDLFPSPPSPPRFSASNISGGTQAIQGSNGWLTGANVCTSSGCSTTSASTVAVVQATVDNPSDPNNNSPFNGILGATVKINGTSRCAHPPSGVSCSAALSSDGHTYTWSFTFSADGVYGLTFTSSAINGQASSFSKEVKVDLHNPTIATATVVASAKPPQGGWYSTPVEVALAADDAVGGSGIQAIDYQLDGSPTQAAGIGQPINVGLAPDGVHTLDGTHTLSFWAVDMAGRQEATHQSFTVQIDSTPPAVACTPDGAWHANDVTIPCTAADAGSGLAQAADGSFGLTASVAAGVETANAATLTRTVCDVVGNCAVAGPIAGIKIDKKPPTITLGAPSDGGTYYLGQNISANYTCNDGGSGVASCTGTLATGSPLDTSSLGTRKFSIQASDNVGNQSSLNATYAVSYRVCPLYDPARATPPGATVPIRLELCTASGADLSSPNVAVTATAVVNIATGISVSPSASGNSNPGNRFRFDPGLGPSGGYIFNLGTGGYPTGTFALQFLVAGDPVTHTALLTLS